MAPIRTRIKNPSDDTSRSCRVRRKIANKRSEVESFQHEALDLQRNVIHAFRISTERGIIRLALEHVEASSEHTAVSYMWGNASPCRNILINGKTLTVRQNLYDFLHEMRRRGRQDWFWVDAICIDQSDTREKNHQVRQMGDIYSKAKEVCLWLGADDAEKDEFLHFLACEFAPQDGKKFCYNAKAIQKKLHEMSSENPTAENVVRQILNDRYWTRGWVIQEVLLSRGKSVLMSGSASITWKAFSQLLLEARRLKISHLVQGTRAYRFCDPAISLDSGQTRLLGIDSIMLRPRYSLESQISRFGSAACSDIRDRVYALHMLASHEDIILVDYSLSAPDIYAKLVQKQKLVSFSQVARFETLLRETLDLHQYQAYTALSQLQTPEELAPWELEISLEKTWTRFDHIPYEFGTLTPLGGLIELRHKVDAHLKTCDCNHCRPMHVPWDRQLFLFSLECAQKDTRDSYYLVAVNGDPPPPDGSQ
jgi:hypothetical protein